MSQDSVFEGTSTIIRSIELSEIQHDPLCSVTPKNLAFPTSYDSGPSCIVVPASPPIWTAHKLPVSLPPDGAPIDPRKVLSTCPIDPLLRASSITCPGLDYKALDLITDRKNLRALLAFVKGKTKKAHRIDAEIIGSTVLFFLGWSDGSYESKYIGYGINFERHFTTSLSEGTIQHNRVIGYTLGGLNLMVKYQVDACKPSSGSFVTSKNAETSTSKVITTPTGLQVIPSGTLAAPETIVEIKTSRIGYTPLREENVAQLWFSQTPLLIAGYHDGNGRFGLVEEINVETTGLLDQWEYDNRTDLQRLVRLIEIIKEHMMSSPVTKQAIILTKTKSASFMRFYDLEDSYELGLPNDLRAKWD